MNASEQLLRVRTFYDRVSPALLDCAGSTFQCRIVRSPGARDEDLGRAMRYMADEAGIGEGDGFRVLDAGCGVGGPAVDLALAFPRLSIDAVTISPVQVGLARQLVAQANLSTRISIHEADYHALPFADATFDRVLFFETIGYSYDLPTLFLEIARVLKPGGKVYVKDVFRREGRLTAREISDLAAMERLWASGPVASLSETAAALSQAGFVDVETAVFQDVGGDRYIGAMWELDGLGGLRLNAFGQEFFRTYAALPTVIGRVRASRPSA